MEAFGRGQVFRDIYGIPPGSDFHAVLAEALKRCEVLLAIIGRGWATSSLSSSEDYVRMEIEAALSRRIVVIPVLVEGSQLPRADDIPSSLLPLLRMQAATVNSGRDFDIHVRWLVSAVAKIRSIRIDEGQNYEAAILDAFETAQREKVGPSDPVPTGSLILERIRAEQDAAITELRGRVVAQEELRLKAKKRREEVKARRARAEAADRAVESFFAEQDARKRKSAAEAWWIMSLAFIAIALLVKYYS